MVFSSVASATAFTGSRVIQAVVPPSISGANAVADRAGHPRCLPYSFSIRIRSTAGTTPQAAPTIGFFTATGTFWPTSPVGSAVTVTTGTGWTTLTISGTAPALLGYATVGVQLFGPTSSYTVQLDGAQFEQAALPTAYVDPGIWYPLFTGGIERYPQTWRASGTLGYIQATAVDALALLSQSLLDDPFMAAAFKPAGGPTPTFAYLLSDSAGSFLDATGQRDVAQLGTNLYGAGTATPGSPVTSTSPGGTFVCPTGMTVVNLQCDGAITVPGAGYPGGFNYIRIPPSNAGAIGPGSAGTGFTRMIAFRLTAAPTSGSAVWMATTGPDLAGVYCSAGLLVNHDLSVSLVMTDHTHQTVGSTRINLGTVDVGNWHLCFFWMSADGASWGGALDDGWYPTTASPPYAMPFGGVPRRPDRRRLRRLLPARRVPVQPVRRRRPGHRVAGPADLRPDRRDPRGLADRLGRGRQQHPVRRTSWARPAGTARR